MAGEFAHECFTELAAVWTQRSAPKITSCRGLDLILTSRYRTCPWGQSRFLPCHHPSATRSRHS
jgi:hypothetical protein